MPSGCGGSQEPGLRRLDSAREGWGLTHAGETSPPPKHRHLPNPTNQPDLRMMLLCVVYFCIPIPGPPQPSSRPPPRRSQASALRTSRTTQEFPFQSSPRTTYLHRSFMTSSQQRKPCLLQLFNRYRERGGEEQSAERIFHQAQRDFQMERLWWDSRDWDGKDAPSKLGQLRRFF